MEPTAIAGLATSALQGLFGLGQSIFSGRRRKEKALEKYIDSYKPNESIMDYYNKALASYDPNAYNSAAYKTQTNNIGRNLATGISASQNRRGGLATIGSLVQGANDASAKAVVDAERLRMQNLGQLGQATGMKSAEDRRKWDMKYNLLAQKAGQAATTQNMGFKNIFGGLGNAASFIPGAKKKTDVPSDTYDYTGDRSNNNSYA